ncbi:TPA: hypothetical protein ACX6S2_003456 [Photobacterium damselae]
MKNALCVLLLLGITPVVMANPGVPPEVMSILQMFLGDDAEKWAAWLAVVLVVWTQLRQIIPPSWLAKLPMPLIVLLETLAGNRGLSRNERLTDPRQLKRERL